MGNAKIFVVEDDPLYAKMLNHKLSMDPEFEVSVFNDGASFLKNLKENPSVVTLDHSLPDISGLDLLKRLKKEYPNINVVVLSAQEDVSTAVEMLREGAYDYIIKDSGAMDKVWHVVHQANEKRNLQAEVEYLTSEITAKYNFQQYLKGSSAPMQRVFSLLEKSAKANITVSITGDTGTGKELAAKSIHFNSERMKKPFIAINVAAIPKELIESELFGYEKGAFTGADQTKMGKFEEANKATHRDLLKEVKEGRFREDLYYRLLGISVEMPPLNERGSDIIVLAKAFIADFCKENGMPKKDLSQEAIDKLMKYKFPGTVRELKAIAEIAAVMSEGNTIEENDVQFNRKNEVDDFIQEELTLEEYNSRIIKWYLNKYNNNVLHVADKLDVGKSTIYRMLKEGKI